MSNDVYVCYADEDKEIAEDVYSALKDRKLKCWMKSHDVRKDVVEEMMAAINESKAMVLIYSSDTRFSDYVNTEVDMAFSKKIPIMVFRTDDSEIEGGLEFFLQSQPKFDAYKNPDSEFKRLIDNTYRVSKDDSGIINFIKKHKVPVAAALAVILIAAVCIYMFVPTDNMNMTDEINQVNASNITVKISDFHMDDVHKKGYGWNYSYSVSGSFSPMPSKGNAYTVTSDFYDKSGNLINSTETSLDELQIIDDGFLLGSAVSDAKDIARVEVQLLNSNNIVLAQGESQLK